MRKSVVLAAVISALLVTPIAVFASHQFTDVPPSHTFHNSIAWMANNGITAGCNQDADEFCPDDFVTRGQMSAFMKRLAEAGVVDAATLAGQDATTLGNPAASDLTNNIQLPLTGISELAELMIDAPVRGGLIIDAILTPVTDVGERIGRFWIQVDDGDCDASQVSSVMHGVLETGEPQRGGSASITGTAVVAAGERTVTLCESAISAGPGNPRVDVSLVAEFTTSITRTGSLD